MAAADAQSLDDNSSRPLPTVDHIERYPDFAVSEAREDVVHKIQKRIPARHIYYAASWQGCSCGFCYDDFDELEATLAQIPDEAIRTNGRADWQSGHNSVTSLARYLADTAIHGPLYLYVAWAGHEGEPITVRSTIIPSYFGGRSFRTPHEDTLFTVVAEELAI